MADTVFPLGMDTGDYDLPARNALAVKTIGRYAAAHAAADSCIGLVGFLPAPGAGAASIAAACLVQIPIYQALAEDLRRIYETDHSDIVQGIVTDGVLLGSAAMLGAGVGVDFAEEFGRAFLMEVGPALIGEMGIGYLMSYIPVVGGFASVGLDVAVAATMTWRVGTMVAICYLNGKRWVGSRKETYGLAKKLTGGLSPVVFDRANPDAFAKEIPALLRHHIEQTARYIRRLLRGKNAKMSDDEVRALLREDGYPEEVIEPALALVRGRAASG